MKFVFLVFFVFFFFFRSPAAEGIQKYPQHCWEFQDQLWEALSGTTSKKRVASPAVLRGKEFWKYSGSTQMPWIIGLGGSQPYSRAEFPRKRSESISGEIPVRISSESPSRIGVYGPCNLGHQRAKSSLSAPPCFLFSCASSGFVFQNIFCLTGGFVFSSRISKEIWGAVVGAENWLVNSGEAPPP